LFYLFFLKSVLSSWIFLDIVIFFILYYLYFILNLTNFQYVYFISIGLIFFLLSLIGWLGFTLNFIILSILYSTLVIVFWSFFIAFEDQKKKLEKSKINFFFFLLILFWSPLGSIDLNFFLFSFLRSLFFFDFFFFYDYSEFFFIFFTIYIVNPATTLFVFLVLVLTCFNIVETLLLKQLFFFLTNFFSQGNIYKKKTTKLVNYQRYSFWSTISTQVSLTLLSKSV